jgi:hypothetical protein
MRRRRLLQAAAAGFAVSAMPLGRLLAQAKRIRIGLLHDLSGPFAGAGSVPLSIGAQLAIDYVNGQGGVLGKYQVEPVNADSQSKVDVAINEAEGWPARKMSTSFSGSTPAPSPCRSPPRRTSGRRSCGSIPRSPPRR